MMNEYKWYCRFDDRNEYYKNRYHNDEEFRNKRKEYFKEYHKNKKSKLIY